MQASGSTTYPKSILLKVIEAVNGQLTLQGRDKVDGNECSNKFTICRTALLLKRLIFIYIYLMKNGLKYKIGIPLISSFALIAWGAYQFTTGNTAFARSLFLWGMISTLAGIIWILIAKRQHQR